MKLIQKAQPKSSIRIGIISDTHDNIGRIRKAVNVFKKEKVVLVYHLGDFCSPFTLGLYKELPCSVKAVFGNNDADIFRMMSRKPDNMEFFGKLYVDEFEGKNICLFHGDPNELCDTIFESKKYDIFLRGHNHFAEVKRNEKTLMINPGTLADDFPGNTYKWTKPSIAIYELEKDSVRIVRI